MKINIYDFDGTIYNGDSTIDFFKFCITKNIKCLLIIPKIVVSYFLYFTKKRNKTEVKEVFFSFLKYFDNIDVIINEFWYKYNNKIKPFYLEKKHNNDIIISASPEFLLKPICKQLNVKDLIASRINKKSGKFNGKNCKGQEKVRRLEDKYQDIEVDEVYTDSYSDIPIINLGKRAFFVKKDKISIIK